MFYVNTGVGGAVSAGQCVESAADTPEGSAVFSSCVSEVGRYVLPVSVVSRNSSPQSAARCPERVPKVCSGAENTKTLLHGSIEGFSEVRSGIEPL